ncbi:MAG: MBL fold metallo-hydrolase [Anaerolineae bacterium]|nr:MBL fold metallo-hydrolase [Anaerolineae bacterium]
MSISRRNLLKGFGLGAMGAVWATSWSQNLLRADNHAPVKPAASAFYRTTVGAFQVTILQDGATNLDQSLFAVNAAPEAVDAALMANNLPTGPQSATLNIALIETADRKILIDTGLNGIALDANPPNSGKLIPTLELLGIAPADITDVLISHHHPDHVAGLSDTVAPLYPNATYHLSQPEYDFLQTTTGNELADGFIASANALLKPMMDADQVQLFNPEDEVIPGIQAILAAGHTPGHTVFLLNSEGSSLLHLMDTANHAAISLANPDWYMGFDAIPDMAAATRRALLERATNEKLLVSGYHFPFPGIGYISMQGEGGFRFTPA